MTTHFLVNKSDLGKTQQVTVKDAELKAGQLRLGIEKFGLTANNITYALLGDLMQYWAFFPAPREAAEGLGQIPMWGFASVVESANPEVEEGARFFGYLPPADFLVVEPGSITNRGFVDASAHRPQHAALYNSYQRISEHDGMAMTDQQENIYMLLWPLFGTAFLIDAFMAANNAFDAQQLLFISASSRTAIAVAAQVAKRGEQQVVGLTSPSNKAFVESLGYYNKVVSYDELEQLDASIATVSVDMAGNAEVLARVHQHFANNLKFSSMVGATHQNMGDGKGLAGPTPELFFAPDQLAKFAERWGMQQLQQRMYAAWLEYAEQATQWLELVEYQGQDGLASAYQRVLAGESQPKHGNVIRLR